MEIVVHMGAPKTGSTSIQNFIALNKKQLLAGGVYLSGICLARNHVEFHSRHSDFSELQRRHMMQVLGLRSERHFESWKKKFDQKFIADIRRAKNQGAQTYLISSEFLLALSQSPGMLEFRDWLTELANPTKIRVIVFFRPQVSTIESMHSTKVWNGETISLREYTYLQLSKGRRLDFWEISSILESVFGEANLHVSLAPVEINSLDLVGEFVACLGANGFNFSIPGHQLANKSLSHMAKDILRLFNLKSASPLGNNVLGSKRYQHRNIISRSFPGGKERLPSPLEIEVINRFKPGNEALLRKYRRVVPNDREGWLLPRASTSPVEGYIDELAAEKFLELLAPKYSRSQEFAGALANFLYLGIARTLPTSIVTSLKNGGERLLKVFGIHPDML